jgi:tetratricopeptide (TPR) repeat protein
LLKDSYIKFANLEPKNSELYLLLGDISHYLYNLNESSYFETAVNNYKAAIQNSPNDYRDYWFLGFHYALSNFPNEAIENFNKAEKLLQEEQPSEFWNDYAMSTAVANMPSHSIYAMDKVRSITGNKGSFEMQLGETIRKRIVDVDKDKAYKKEEIWAASRGDKWAFISRPLGIKILVDSTWQLSAYDYNNRQGAFVIMPPRIKGKSGNEVGFTIAVLMKVADESDNLESYLNIFTSKSPNKTKKVFSNKYEKIVAYEIIDPSLYPEMGGSHLYVIGIERTEPQYPGLVLENPMNFPNGNSQGVTYYRANDSKNRFRGKIFYAIIFDSCEDIFEKSFPLCKSFFDNQILIE